MAGLVPRYLSLLILGVLAWNQLSGTNDQKLRCNHFMTLCILIVLGVISLFPTFSLSAFVMHASDCLRRAFVDRRPRPWSEFIDQTAFCCPDSLSKAILRVHRNFAYFRFNYLTLVAALASRSFHSRSSLASRRCLFLLTHLDLLGACLFFYHFRSSDHTLVKYFGRRFSNRETLRVLTLHFLVVLTVTSLTIDVGWLLMSDTLVGVVITCIHGAFRAPEDWFPDDEEFSEPSMFVFLLLADLRHSRILHFIYDAALFGPQKIQARLPAKHLKQKIRGPPGWLRR